MRKILALAAFAALLIVPAASAANGKLVVSPSPAVVGDSLVFSGCGYPPGYYLQVRATYDTKAATYILYLAVETDDLTGCFSTSDTPYAVPAAGKWTINVFDYDSGQKLATLNLTVT